MKFLKILSIFIIAISLNGCSVYNFTGAKPIDAKSFQVNFFQNTADLIEPGIERRFTIRLQEIIQNQTNLDLTNFNADLLYDGEIVEYRITPMQATASQTAAESRLTISVMVRFSNKNKEADNFERRFSFYRDYQGSSLPTGSVLNDYIDEIFERITQDVFNESLAKW
jgi:hypothetical protein